MIRVLLPSPPTDIRCAPFKNVCNNLKWFISDILLVNNIQYLLFVLLFIVYNMIS